MVTYKDLYKKLDPILQAKPKIMYPELLKKHPDIKITYWSFNNRKNKLAALKKEEQKALKKAAKESKPLVKKVTKKPTKTKPAKPAKIPMAEVRKFIRETKPNTNKFGAYVASAKVLMRDPNAVHSQHKKEIKMCDANFYQFRKSFCARFNLPLTAALDYSKRKLPKRKPATVSVKTPAVTSKPKLCTVLYETPANGFDRKALGLMTDIFTTLRKEGIADLEITELIHPKKVVEVRSYKR